MVQYPCNSTLTEQLRHLSARPNRFQAHALASLRVLDRRRNKCATRQLKTSEENLPDFAEDAEKAADDWEDMNSQCVMLRQMSSPTPREAGLLRREHCGSWESIKEVSLPREGTMSDPLLSFCRSTRRTKMPSVYSLPVLDNDSQDSWPPTVVELLQTLPRGTPRREAAHNVVPATEGLRFSCGSCQIPHPRKVTSGGEDSLFVCPHGSAVGVADGVGEWEWRFGLNPRAFADELMSGACSAAENTQGVASLSPQERVATLLSEGYAATKSFGSSTVVVAALDNSGSQIGVANLGDSGLRHIRWQPSCSTDVGGTHIVNRTVEQQHEFNCPYQLSRLPGPSDFEELRRQGKEKLVKALEKTAGTRQDMPSNADLFSFSVQEGDLILLGSDGVFDNLHDCEVCHLMSMATSPLEARRSGGTASPGTFTDPASIAEALAEAARCRSLDASAKTPFGQNAAEAGLYHVGGKVDDVSVVAAWVVKSSE